MLDDITESEAEELRAKHGATLRAVEAASEWIVFRKPTRHEYDRYLDTITSDRGKTREAAWQLAQSCCVRGALKDAMEAEPAILLADFLPALNDMAGDGREKRTVKL